jgi:DNA-binding transcriptional LysR family regulator
MELRQLGIRGGRYDLVFIGLGPDDPEGLELRIVADEPIVAVVGPEDPLADEPSVPLSEIADRAVIDHARGCFPAPA